MPGLLMSAELRRDFWAAALPRCVEGVTGLGVVDGVALRQFDTCMGLLPADRLMEVGVNPLQERVPSPGYI